MTCRWRLTASVDTVAPCAASDSCRPYGDSVHDSRVSCRPPRSPRYGVRQRRHRLLGGNTHGFSHVGFVAVFGAMFAIANPFSGLPFYLGYTSPLATWQSKLFAAVVTVATVWVGGVIVLYAGNAVLGFFGVAIDGLRVGGGFVILLSGISMMNTHVDDTKKAGRSLWRVVRDLVHRGHSPVHAAAAVHASSPDAAASLAANAKATATDDVSVAVNQAVAGDVPPAQTPEQVAAGRRAAFLSLMFRSPSR